MKKRRKGTSVRHSRSAVPARPRKGVGRMRATQSKRESPSAADSPLSSPGVYALSAECTVAASDTLKSGLLEVVDAAFPITLDIAAVQRIDTAGMQLIAAFVRERESHGRRVEWCGSAPAFTSAARLLGLTATLGLSEPAQ